MKVPDRETRNGNGCRPPPRSWYELSGRARSTRAWPPFPFLNEASKIEFHGDLHFPGSAGAGVSVDHAEVRRAVCHVRRGERGGVRYVEALETQLNVFRFRK